jgi:thiol-disulfide isomerase/thioredoxin
MKHLTGCLILFAATCSATDPIAVLVDRIWELAEREQIESSIDTRLRAAQILMPSEPELAKKFLASGMELLRVHPEVERNRNITACVIAMNVPDGVKVLLAGTDRLEAYNQLLWHLASRGELDRALAVLETGLHEGLAKDFDKFWGFGRVMQPLTSSNPEAAAQLFVELAKVTREQKAQANLVRVLGNILPAFVNVRQSRPAEVVAAFRLMIPVVGNTEFPGPGAGVLPVNRQFGGQMVEIQDPHKAVLFRFGTYLHALAPEVYQESRALFAPWEEAIGSKVLALFERQPMPFNNTGPRIDFHRAPLAEALAAVDKLSKEGDKIDAYESLVDRNDLSADQRAQIIERARELIRSGLPARLNAWQSSVNFHQTARQLRWAGVTPESDHPSLKAKLALMDLEDAVQPGFDFTLPDPNGKPHKLSDERGKVVLVNFWATWCPPCRAEMPMFSKLYREWGAKGLSMLAISDESTEVVTSYERQFHHNVPVLLDPARKVFDHYRVHGMPDTRILDRSGRVVASFGSLVSEEELVLALRAAGLE